MDDAKIPDMPAEVAAVFGGYDAPLRAKLLAVRRLIFETAAATEGAGPLTECLKWSEPAYLTEATGSGSTIRIGPVRNDPGRCAVFVNCKTSLIDTYRTLFAGELSFAGNRAVLLNVTGPLPAPLAACIGMALTYHLGKRKRRPA